MDPMLTTILAALVAAGRIKLGPVISEMGDATVRNLRAGTDAKNS